MSAWGWGITIAGVLAILVTVGLVVLDWRDDRRLAAADAAGHAAADEFRRVQRDAMARPRITVEAHLVRNDYGWHGAAWDAAPYHPDQVLGVTVPYALVSECNSEAEARVELERQLVVELGDDTWSWADDTAEPAGGATLEA